MSRPAVRELALALCAVVALSGCTTQLSRAEIIAAQGQGAGTAQDAGVGTTTSSGAGTVDPGSGSVPGAAAAGAGGGEALAGDGPATANGPGTSSGSGGPNGSGPGSATGDGAAPGAAPGAGPARGGSGSGPGTGPGAGSGSGGGTAKANGAPVVLGSIGSISGLYGTVFKPMLDGIQIHVADLNSRGGVNGHPIRLIVADDNADPANYFALVRRMVEKDKVVGFVNLHGVVLSQSVIDYVEKQGIPIIDGDDSNQLSGTSRMIFGFGGAGVALNGSEVGAAAQIVGRGKKVGFLSCQEVQQCTDYANSFPGFARKAGLDPTYAGRASLTAPDFTQNCLQARNAGIEVLFLRMDTNSVKRIARDCSRQSFTPKYALAPALTDASFPPNKALEGTIIPGQTFPFILANTPQEKAFQAAMRRNRPADQINAGNGQGWVVASILAKALESTPPDATPSTALLLKGLYTFKGERLQGQSQALTYLPGKPPAHASKSCFFPMLLTGGRWTAPKGEQLFCL